VVAPAVRAVLTPLGGFGAEREALGVRGVHAKGPHDERVGLLAEFRVVLGAQPQRALVGDQLAGGVPVTRSDRAVGADEKLPAETRSRG